MSPNYSDLIKTICETISDGTRRSPDLLLVPERVELPPLGNGRTREVGFIVPAAMLPDDVEPHHLSGDETYLENAEKLIQQQSPPYILAVSPWLREIVISRDWRNSNPRMGLIEALAQQVFHPGRPQARDQPDMEAFTEPVRTFIPDLLILFVPRGFVESRRNGDWRSRFFKEHATSVIEHDHHLNIPGFGLAFNAQFRAVTLVIQPQPGPTRFFKISQDVFLDQGDAVVSDLKSLLMKQEGTTRFGHIYRGDMAPDYPTTIDCYSGHRHEPA